MYHAVANGAVPDGQDPHYTLPLTDFVGHLDLIGQQPGGGGCARDWLHGSFQGNVLLTFDDGHLSNYQHAFPALLTHAMRADFFVNPALVGSRGFADWAALREMAEAGMSIQSHGYDHVYLTSLGEKQLRDNLKAAREQIEDHVGTPVTLLAPPGGRMPRNLWKVARECGYEAVLSSQPGRIARTDLAAPMPRMAVTADLSDAGLRAWLQGTDRAMLRERLRYGTLGWAKRVLGDHRYERVRSWALNHRRGPA